MLSMLCIRMYLHARTVSVLYITRRHPSFGSAIKQNSIRLPLKTKTKKKKKKKKKKTERNAEIRFY